MRAFNPAPGAWFEVKGERIKILAAERCRRRRRSRATVLDDRADDRLRRRARSGRLWSSAPGVASMTPASCCAGFPIPAGTQLVTRFALTVEYDGRPVHGLAAAGPRPERPGRRSRRRCERSPARRSRSTPPGAPMPGCMRWRCARMSTSRKPITPFRLMEALNARLRPASGRDPGVRGRARRLACALLVHRRGTTSIASSTAARR